MHAVYNVTRKWESALACGRENVIENERVIAREKERVCVRERK